jgi:hypothetical protein
MRLALARRVLVGTPVHRVEHRLVADVRDELAAVEDVARGVLELAVAPAMLTPIIGGCCTRRCSS